MSQTPASSDKCTLSALQQSLIAVSVLFIAVGSSIAGIVGPYFGRRGTIQVGSVLVLAGAGGMIGTSGNFTAYIACKCIQGLGLGHYLGSAPAYGVEFMVPQKRGMLTALLNCGLGMGNVVAAVVCLGTASYGSNLAWQMPIMCQLPLAVILGAGVLYFPESPRWLLINGKEEDARKSFARIYNTDPNSPEVSTQVQEVLQSIVLETPTESKPD